MDTPDLPPERGRCNEWLPSPEQRKLVLAGVVGGMSHADIARGLRVSVDTLKAHCAEELERGKSAILLELNDNGLDIARDRYHPKHESMLRFFLDRKAGFTQKIQHGGDPENPTPVGVLVVPAKKPTEPDEAKRLAAAAVG